MSTFSEFYQDRYALRPGADAGQPEREATFDQRARMTLAAIGAPPRRVLDFGCNTGALARRLAAAGHAVTGVDISASAVHRARADVREARFERIEGETRLPFAAASFDACVCTEVIEHLFAVRAFIREVHRVLAERGLFILTTPYHGWVKNLLIISWNFERHFQPTGGHIRFFSKRSLADCLQREGFVVDGVAGVGRVWPLWKSMFVTARKRS
jgi:2-polyprenyl-3-methyl-5-hydroxy-6-metoxy-1,4-benzoquinol methylase